jgi:thiamine-phosphate pyrophosphorylase
MNTARKERVRLFTDSDLYVVTSQTLSNGRSDNDVLDAVINGGGKIIQLRDKVSTKAELYKKARSFRTLTATHGILLIINDHIDIALAVDADGVHLGQDDLPLQAARKIAPSLIIGRSTHSLEKALDEENNGADYVNLGPIFPTNTKTHACVLGTNIIRNAAKILSIPFSVMGGIKERNITEVVDAGARHIALVTAVTQAENMSATVKHLRTLILRDVGKK